jgi:GTPase SAR1 family protein
MEFANDESSLANEAEVILQLKEIEKELDIITQFPIISKKNIISIGGAFSSGKSEFINSFLKNKQYKLPVGINPVTAIPTYVVSDSQNNIKGYSNNGAAISIESEFYRQLSHDFVKSFKFNLKDIMPFITMGTPLKDLDNVCFIDTPGYNPGSTDGFTAEDKSTAEEYVAKSKVLIWMMNIEDGVLQSSDVEFLENLDLTDKKLYIVANKADRIPMDSIEDTLDEIEEILDDYEIEYVGISAYSALEKEEYHFIKKTLYDFLQEQNSEKMMDDNNIIPRVNDIMNQYDEAINEDLKEIKLLKRHMHSLELDLLQEGFEDDNAIVSNRIHEIRKVFDVKLLEEHLKVLNQLRKKFNMVLEEIFETKINPVVNTKKDKKPNQEEVSSTGQEQVEQNLSPYLRKYSKPNISFS